MKQIETQYHHTLKSLERLLEEFKGTDEYDLIRDKLNSLIDSYMGLVLSRSSLKNRLKESQSFCSKVRERNYKTI